MYRDLNIFANTHSPTQGHPWEESAVSTLNLVGRWILTEGFGNTAYDVSGGTDNGVWSGPATGNNGTYYSTGVVSAYAGTFAVGGNTKVTLTPPLALAGDTAKTMTAWFNCSNVGPNEQDIVTFGTDSNGETFGLGLKNGGNVFGHVGGASDLDSQVTITGNTWYFAAITYDNTTSNVSIYVDGNLKATETYTLNTGTTSFFFGQHLTNPSSFFPGLLNDVRIYDVALSSANVQAIYEGRA